MENQVAPLASVIVPAANAGPLIRPCVDALQAQTLAPAMLEIIVVDDGSTDDTIMQARAAGATVLTPGKVGKSGARNVGAAAARGRYLLFTDADCRPAPDWVEQMLQPMQRDERIVGVKGAYWSDQAAWLARFTQLEVENRYDRMRRSPYIDFVDTYAAAFRRDIFLAQGGFDTRLFEAEDAEFSFRLAAQGYRLVFAPRARVWHQHPTSMVHYCRRKFALASGRAQVVRRYPARLLSDSRTPQALKAQMLTATGAAFWLPLALVWSGARRYLGVSAFLFVLSSLSFLAKCLRRDPPILLMALPMLFLRGLALTSGYLYGAIWSWLPASWQGFRPWHFPRQRPVRDQRAGQD